MVPHLTVQGCSPPPGAQDSLDPFRTLVRDLVRFHGAVMNLWVRLIYVCVSVCMCVYICEPACVCMCVCKCVYMCLYVWSICLFVTVHAITCVCMCIHACVGAPLGVAPRGRGLPAHEHMLVAGLGHRYPSEVSLVVCTIHSAKHDHTAVFWPAEERRKKGVGWRVMPSIV